MAENDVSNLTFTTAENEVPSLIFAVPKNDARMHLLIFYEPH